MTALIVNGWTVLAHFLFIEQYEALLSAPADAQSKTPDKASRPGKLLAAIIHLITVAIPADPANPVFSQGKTLGEGATHWKRAKFYQQFRLFYRYDARSKIIIMVWFNDESTKRAYDSKTDAYKVFRKMLKHGNPPNQWADLLADARSTREWCTRKDSNFQPPDS